MLPAVEIGYFALILACVFSLYATAVSFAAGKLERSDLARSAEAAAFATTTTYLIVTGCLLYLLGTSAFQLEAVFSHTNRSLPLFYKLTSMWAGQSGSLILWGLLTSIFGAIIILNNRNRNRILMPYVTGTMFFIVFFFAMVSITTSNPFKVLDFTPADGRGLNPLLQHWAMIIHPPTLYLGYTGFTVPFAFMVAGLLTRYPGSRWIQLSRRWTLFAWFFLTAGILLGGKWAYMELGWGGYWAWDPVENASLMPWFTGTAFLHSVMIQEKKGMLKNWNVSLIMLTFALCLFGTYLTRSGIIQSVHAFAQGGFFGYLFLGLLLLIIFFSLWLMLSRQDYLRSRAQIESFVSRETGFLFQNLMLVGMCFAVLWMTLFPVISRNVQGVEITVGPSVFNTYEVPMGLILLLLTGLVPFFAWRRTSLASLKSNLIFPTAASLIALVVMLALNLFHFYAVVSAMIAAFTGVAIIQEFVKGISIRQRTMQENPLDAMVNLVKKNKRRYGGYIVHFGAVILFIGFTGAAFEQEKEQGLEKGQSMTIGDYSLKFTRFAITNNDHYQSYLSEVEVFKNGDYRKTVYPERRIYHGNDGQPTTEVELVSSIREDLYVVLHNLTGQGKVVIKAFINPFVNLVWLGGVIMILGTVICMIPEKKSREDIELSRLSVGKAARLTA